MLRKLLPTLGLAVLLIASAGGALPAWAIVSGVTLSNETCASVTVQIDYTSPPTPPNTNQLVVTVVNADVSATLTTVTVAAPDTAGTVTASPTWAAVAAGTSISVTVAEQDSGGGAVGGSISEPYSTYCSNGGAPSDSAAEAGPPGFGDPSYVDPGVARERERGITRLFSDTVAVVYRMPNGDIQFYLMDGSAGRYIGTAPGWQINPRLYGAGQYVGQFGYGDNRHVDLYFNGWNGWQAVYANAGGGWLGAAWFEYGNANAGPAPAGNAPPRVGRPDARGQGGGGGGTTGTTPPVVTAPQIVTAPNQGQGGYLNPNPPAPWPFLDPSIAGINPATTGALVPPQPGVITPAGQPQQNVPFPANNLAAPPAGIAPPSGWITVTARWGGSVHTARDASALQLAALNPGEPVTLVARDGSGTWALAILPNGQYGWTLTTQFADMLPQIMTLPAVQ